MKKIIVLICYILLYLSSNKLLAQFSLDGQILQRAEYRNGFGRLLEKNQEAAFFIAHRVRLQSSYQTEKMKFYASIQDIRTWGNTPQVKASDAFLSLHEGWAEIELSPQLNLKLGRQELNYDNFRFLGNLDWALQGRAHDFALLKYEKNSAKLHIGGGFNQQVQRDTSTTYILANQYKTAHMARYENQWKKWNLSIFLWNEGRENQGRHFYKQTIGLPNIQYKKNKTTISAFYYHQLGKDIQDRPVNAFDASLQVKKEFSLIKHQEDSVSINTPKNAGKLQIVLGVEVISGTNSNEAQRNTSFSLLYGTNHIFNGFMDLFFVGGSFENGVGLQDYYLKTRYYANEKLFVQTDAHVFQTYSKYFVGNETLEKFLGTEIDLSCGFVLSKSVSVQGGYSQVFASNTLKTIKLAQNPKEIQNWMYIMLIIRPTMKNKFIGISI